MHLPVPTVTTNSCCKPGCKHSHRLRCLQPLIKFPALGNERCYLSSKAAALTQHRVERRACFFTFLKGQPGNAPEALSSNTSSLTKTRELYLGSCQITRATRTRVSSVPTNLPHGCLAFAALVFSSAQRSVLLRWWDPRRREERLLVKLITNNAAA